MLDTAMHYLMTDAYLGYVWCNDQEEKESEEKVNLYEYIIFYCEHENEFFRR